MDKRQPMAGQAEASSKSEARLCGELLWIVDSAASHHVTNKSSNVANYITTDGRTVPLANGQTADAMRKGSPLLNPQTGVPFSLKEVLYVPSLADDVLSERAVTLHGGAVHFVEDTCAVH